MSLKLLDLKKCFPTSCSSEQTVSMTLFYCFYSAFPLHVFQIKQFQGHYFIISIVLSHFMFFRANSFKDNRTNRIMSLKLFALKKCFPTSCSSDQAISRTLFYCFYSAFPLHVFQIKQFQGHYFIISIVLSHFMFFRANSFKDIILFVLYMKWESTIETIK